MTRSERALIVLMFLGAVATALLHAIKEWRTPAPPAPTACIGAPPAGYPRRVCLADDSDTWRCGAFVEAGQ